MTKNDILLEICGDTDFDFEILLDNRQIHVFSWLYLGEFSISLGGIDSFQCPFCFYGIFLMGSVKNKKGDIWGIHMGIFLIRKGMIIHGY